MQNPNCDGGWCEKRNGEVRKYPLGGGANLILCQSCFSHENHYRLMRSKETNNPKAWPHIDWSKAEVYPQP